MLRRCPEAKDSARYSANKKTAEKKSQLERAGGDAASRREDPDADKDGRVV